MRIWETLSLLLFLSTVSVAYEPKVLFEHDPTLLTTTIEIVLRSGMVDDPPGKNGLANLLGDFVLRGTKKKIREKFQSELERLGGTLGARATQDTIVFGGRVIKENTLPFLKLIEEAILTPAFSDAEFKSLKTETLAQISNIKNVNARLGGLALRRQFFQGTSLERPIEGSLTSVSNLQKKDLLLAYNNYFSRGNIVFGVVSPLAPEAVKAALTQTWLKFPDGAARSRRSLPFNVPSKTTLIVVHKPNTSTGSLLIGQPGIAAQDPLRYTLEVGNFAFGSEPLISRIFKIIRSQLGWTYAIGTTYFTTGPLTYQQGIYVMNSTPSIEFTGKTLFKLISMFREYHEGGLKSDELKLAEESMINSYPFEFDSPEKRVGKQLYSYLYGVPILNQEEYAKKIGNISSSDIVKALKQKHEPNRWVITLVADKNVIQKQLDEEQKSLPADQRLTIAKVYTPDDLVK